MVPPRAKCGQNYSNLRGLKRKRDEENLELLKQRVSEVDLKSATPPTTFHGLPLSAATQSGLKDSHFEILTNIQSSAIPKCLKGADILGAAQTGSGKTLAFLVPVLENLYRKRWAEYDGLGALILSPTRELAIQIFEVLRKIGRYHSFSAGLVIGGKSFKEECERMWKMNILVATPGRMLQHMDQTAEFEVGNLAMLVLDEADRILDMGFSATVDAIIEHLPKSRQTLLFSATQTKRVSDLARLSLKDPEFVSVCSGAESATPSTLQQNYIITPLPGKLDTLWSFMRANLKSKILVFLSSAKQVRFVYEAFRHLQPGMPLLHIHGRQKQTARLDITTKFSKSKAASLFATDIAARGLDFPAVDWVVQVDCPEDADTYIHRVGRTARYERDGRAILFLDPSEEPGMLSALERKKVFLEEISVKQGKMQSSIKSQLQNMCFKDSEIKYLGQKAFVTYVKSVHLQKDKEIFKIRDLDLEGFAASMGLPGAPRVKFVKGEDTKLRKNAPRALTATLSDSETEGQTRRKVEERPAIRTKYDRIFKRRNQDVLAPHYAKMIDYEEGPETNGYAEGAIAEKVDTDDNDFLAVRRRFDAGDASLGADAGNHFDAGAHAEYGAGDADHLKGKGPINLKPNTSKKVLQLSNSPSSIPLHIGSNRKAKMLKSRKALLKYKGKGTHVVFDSEDDDNVGHPKVAYEREEEFRKVGAAEEQRERYVRAERELMEGRDPVDKTVAKEKRRAKKEKKDRARERLRLESGETRKVVLAPLDEDELAIDLDGRNINAGLEERRYKKKQMKRFEDASAGDEGMPPAANSLKKNVKTYKLRRVAASELSEEPQTLGDLETMASGLLAA